MTTSHAPRRLLITGTDTGVGKTAIACALIRAWRQQGRRIAPFKPFETGCAADPTGRPIASDALQLANAAGLEPSDPAPVGYALPTPASPEEAAARGGVRFDLLRLEQTLVSLSAEADLTLIEGAGGLLVPIQSNVTIADLARAWNASLLVVARTALGTINHTLLTLEAARHRDLHIVGVVLNQTMRTAGIEEDATHAAIARHGRVAVFGKLPFLDPAPSELPVDTLADIARSHLDLQGLWEAL